MSCPRKVNSDKIELTVRTSCYCVIDLLCVRTMPIVKPTLLSFTPNKQNTP